MEDPKPENIAGSKQIVHKVEHQVNWGYVALGLAGLAVAYVGYQAFTEPSSGDETDDYGVMER